MNDMLLVGIILLMALVGGHLVQLIRIPEVVGYFFIGLFLGPSFSSILTHDSVTTLEFFSEIALGLILFSIGSVFDIENIRKIGRTTLWMTLYVMLGTVGIVFPCLLMAGLSWQVSLLLSVIAIEISPVATVLVLRESNSEGPLTDTINNLLALNNVVCLIAFGLATFIVRIVEKTGGSIARLVAQEVFTLVWTVFGSIAVAIVLGYVLAAWAKKIEEHGEVLILVFGVILTTVGITHWLGLSSLIATMALGAVLINLSKESGVLFSSLGRTDPPIYALFFVLAGAHLDVSSLKSLGAAGIIYTATRAFGKVLGAKIGAWRLGLPPVVSRFLGWTLLAHAGVAIGLAFQARSLLPRYADALTTVILGSVLVSEVAGPMLTKLAIEKSGETSEKEAAAFGALS